MKIEPSNTNAAAGAELQDAALGRRSLLERHQAVLLDLARVELHPEDADLPFRILTEVSARTLFVERVGVWVFDPARTKICCLDLFEASTDSHTKGMELLATNAPTYFGILEENRVVSAPDVQHDPRTSELAPGYLEPLGIVSMLDAPVRQGGALVGVICHEHVGSMRMWSPEEENFAGSIADMAALVLEQRDRVHAELEVKRRDELLDGVARAANRLFADAEIQVTERDGWLRGLAEASVAVGESPELALAAIVAAADLDRAAIYALVDADAGMKLERRFASGKLDEGDCGGYPASLSAVPRSAFVGGLPALVGEAPAGERSRRLACPIFTDGALAGFLEVASAEEREWSSAPRWALEIAVALVSPLFSKR